MKNIKIVLRFGICAVIAAIFLGAWVMNTDRSNAASNGSSSLIGSWHEVSSDKTQTDMIAEISADHIDVSINLGGVTDLYWTGTFNTDQTSNSFSVTSVVLPNAEDHLSQDVTKAFNYKNGVLSYQFTVLGVTNTIHLSRGE